MVTLELMLCCLLRLVAVAYRGAACTQQISWEAHLFGLATGCVFGVLDAKFGGDRDPVTGPQDLDADDAAVTERERLLP